MQRFHVLGSLVDLKNAEILKDFLKFQLRTASTFLN